MKKVAFDILRHFCKKFNYQIIDVELTYWEEDDETQLLTCTLNRLPKTLREKNAYYNFLLKRMAKYGYILILK